MASFISLFLIILIISRFNIAYSSSSSLYSNSSSSSTLKLCSQEESSALLNFKKTFVINRDASDTCEGCLNEIPYKDCNGISYPKTDNWKVGSDCCSWDGITCDEVSGHVIDLDLSCSQLQGVIHSNNSLFHLRKIQILNLAFNDFTGSNMSFEFGKFADLTHLNLSHSYLSGLIPSEVSILSNLVSLDLSWNIELEGYVPTPFANLTKLTHLDLSYNSLTGHVSSTICSNLMSLEFLDLSNNLLESRVPNSFGKLRYLKVVRLDFNRFTGNFPSSFANLSQLTHLSISNNHLTGPLPLKARELRLISVMDLSYNSLSGNIPSWLFTRPSLVTLNLQGNHLTGDIPLKIGNLLNLSALILSSNFISGMIPPSLFNLPSLLSLKLDNNLFFGSIPSNITGLQKLDYLGLSNNALNGTIPSKLVSLPLLTSFDLSNNKFTGHIGEFQSKSLFEINLSCNNLQGVNFSSISNLVNLYRLNFASNNLTGTFDLDLIFGLQQLYSINLSHNNHLSLEGSEKVDSPYLQVFQMSNCSLSYFPLCLKNLVGLHELDLSNNSIHGPLPEWLGNIGKSSLYSLNISHNFLTSVMEILPWKKLEIIDLSVNLLEGALPVLPSTVGTFLVPNNKISGEIHPRICNNSRFSEVDFSRNNLSGKIPSCLLNSYSLNLQRNNLSGIIPETYAPELRKLYLSHNQLEGHIPRSLANCPSLAVLDLSYNFIYDTFPNWLETLSELEILILRANRLHGSIGEPRHASSFTKLSIIDLSYNQFSGTLPSHYFRMWKSMMWTGGDRYQHDDNNSAVPERVTLANKGQFRELEGTLYLFKSIDFSNNKFDGKIPESIGFLNSLVALNLSSNSLKGVIPPSMGNLFQLESLDLSNNKLYGKIPNQLNNLTFLGTFNVSQNNLEGSIPQSGQLSTIPEDAYQGNPGLCGIPLPKKCHEVPAQHSPSERDRQDSDSILSGLIWESVAIGYGGGAIIGIVIGNIIIRRNEEWVLSLFNIRLIWRIKMTNEARRE